MDPIYVTEGWIAFCPCGIAPSELCVTDAGQGGKWANVSGNCCGEWTIEFRAHYSDGDELKEYARQAWNDAPRG